MVVLVARNITLALILIINAGTDMIELAGKAFNALEPSVFWEAAQKEVCL